MEHIINILHNLIWVIVVILQFLSQFDATIAVLIASYVAIKKFRFQSTHKKRLEIIEQAYEKIKKASVSFKSLVNIFQFNQDEERRIRLFVEDANDMISFLEKKRLFFTSAEQHAMDNVTKKFFELWSQYRLKETIKSDRVHTKESYEIWQKVFESAEQEIPNLIALLESEFKKTLGLK
jgi:hypothetical protein